MSPSLHRATAARGAQQRGAATLVVVMVLFFIISLVAAYTNRNLIFEQRTSANQYRSTQALEAAEAGLEWAISQLNFSRIGNDCLLGDAAASPPDLSFRERYIATDATTGKYTPVPNSAGGDLTPACVWTGSGWTCSCPTTGGYSLTAPSTTAQAPAFRLRFVSIPGIPVVSPTVPRQPGAIRVEVVGCTRLDVSGSPCLTFDGQGALNEGRVVLSSLLALGGNAIGLPQAALTVRGAVNMAGGLLSVNNTVDTGAGLTIQAGGAIGPLSFVSTTGPAGTPPAATRIAGDASVTPASAGTYTGPDRSFASVFNLPPEAFRTAQGTLRLTCAVGGCSAATVRDAIAMNPGRPIWLSGGLLVDSAGDIGSNAQPVLLIVNGDVSFPTAGVSIHGLTYLRLPVGTTAWTTSGSGRFNGAVVVDGNVAGSGDVTIAYDTDLLQRLRYASGSFVRVPGSWRDFQ